MSKCQPQEYNFIPRTWIFPAEYTQFQNYVKELRRKRKQKTFIVKPANGAMGHGYVGMPALALAVSVSTMGVGPGFESRRVSQ